MEVYKSKNNLDSMVYVRPAQLAKLLNLSRTTVWRLLNAFSAEAGNEHAVIEISKTLKLVPLYRFQEWLTKQDKKYLQK
jgi:hypothetical protein